MTDLNKVVLIGRIVRDFVGENAPKYSSKGKAILNFSLAVNESRKTETGYEDKGNFFNVVAFGSLADMLVKYAGKGSQIGVSGHLTQETWQDKTTGQKRSVVKIIAETVQLIGKRKGEQGQEQQSARGEEDIPPFKEDIPF